MSPVAELLGVELPMVELPTVGVVGGGTMGTGIAYVFAAAGCTTTVVEPDSSKRTALLVRISEVAHDAVRRGKFTDEQQKATVANVCVVSSVSELPEHLSVVIESVPERVEAKAKVLGEIDQRSPKLIATNTSALSVSELAKFVSDPASFVGMHFFNPVWSLALVEIVRGDRTSDLTVQHATDLVTVLKKKPIVVRDSPGFATSRLDLIVALEAMRMVQDGVATAADIDTAMVTAYRHPMGPLRLSDLVGLDVRLDIACALSSSLGERYAPPQILKDLVAAGKLGQKTGTGFYDWNHQP
jgi:3-hydroxybutyryl-CoA dehydrogenase